MGRRGNSRAPRVRQFMALLQTSESSDSPQTKLLDEAGRLCQLLQESPARLEALVTAMAHGRHWQYLLSSLPVVRAGVLVHVRKSQYNAACRLLESCRAAEKEELVKLWYEVHYRNMMEKQHMPSLSAVQKYRCRKRNPPPTSLCPEGVQSRSYPEEVRRVLKHFATEVSTNPSRKQREDLARDTSLQVHHIYNWFANYRRRQMTRGGQAEGPGLSSSGLEDSACQAQRRETLRAEAAGGPCEGAGVVQVEGPPGACRPGREQEAGAQGCWGKEAPLGLHTSPLQSSQLEGLAVRLEAEEPTETTEATSCFAPEGRVVKVETGWEPASAAASLWVQDSVRQPCEVRPTPPSTEGRPISRPAPKAAHKAVQCSLWSWGASCEGDGCRSKGNPPLGPGARVSPGLRAEAWSQTVSEQADLDIERLVCRERQPGSSEAHRAAQDALGKPPCCPMALVPPPGESHGQVGFSELYAFDTHWAAWLLCELSCSGRV